MDVIFDMETGDPDDLITLIMLLRNPQVCLRAITCYQGSPLQIGLIKHVLDLAGKNIPVGGWNPEEPKEISPYYQAVVGNWKSEKAQLTPVEAFQKFCTKDNHVLTGASLTNLKAVLENLPELEISSMTTQGGYLGELAKEILPKFKSRKEIRTYNLTSDVNAFTAVNYSTQIHELTYVTKDLCHGFMYDSQIHSKIQFGQSPLDQLLKKCFEHYIFAGKSKAMHDPLAMLYMLYPEIGETTPIEMNYRVNSEGSAVFSSVEGCGSRFGLTAYDKNKAWEKFIEICSISPQKKNKP